jgi:hypothetical protein
MELDSVRELREIAATARDRLLITAHRGRGDDMEAAPDKVAALLDTTRALAAIGAPYALIGGVAVGIHSGVPRAMADTDIAVLSTVDRGTVCRALTVVLR